MKIAYLLSICIVILFGTLLSVRAQSSQRDSLVSLLEKQVADTNRVILLTRLTRLFANSDSEVSIKYGNEALELAENLSYKKGLAMAYANLAIAYDINRNSLKATEMGIQALRLFETINDLAGLSSIYNTLGAIYRHEEKFEQSLVYFEKSIELKTKIGDKIGIARGYNNIAGIYDLQGNDSLALITHKKSLSIKNQLKDEAGIANSFHNIGAIYFKQKQFDTAHAYQVKALPLAEKTNDRLLIYNINSLLCDLAFEQKKYQLSLKHASKCMDLAKFFRNILWESSAHERFSRAYAALGDFKKAYDNHLQFIRFKDSLNTKENIQKIEKLKYEYELEKKEVDNKVVLDVKQSTITRQRYIGMGMIVVAISLGLASFTYFKSYKQKNKDNGMLQLQKEEIQLQSESIQQQNKRLEELNLLKNKLLSIISHDFRSPLNSLKGVLTLMSQGVLTNEEMKMLSTDINANVGVALHLLDNLLHWAKSQMDGFQVHKQAFDIAIILQQNYTLALPLAMLKKINLKNEMQKEIVVMADIDLIDIVVRNLLSNAIKFCKADDSVVISAWQDENMVLVSVTDTGSGIGPDKLATLFEAEKAISTLGTANEKGTGLGLTLCKEFIQKNGGDIWVTSKLGEGSTFSFSIPMA